VDGLPYSVTKVRFGVASFDRFELGCTGRGDCVEDAFAKKLLHLSRNSPALCPAANSFDNQRSIAAASPRL
jgi:hypothetical protein